MSLIATLLHRAPRLSAGSPASTRLQVCPPRPRAPGQPWYLRLLQRLHLPVPLLRPMDKRTAAARNDFFDALADITGAESQLLTRRLERTRSLRELWHLRAVVYNLVATQHNQAQAELRLLRLNRHFPTRSPRSGFMPLDV